MAKKRKTSTKSKKVSVERYKPTLFIDSKNLRGNSLEVGKKVRVEVSGMITEESLRDYEAEGRKSYKLEINKVRVPKTNKKGSK